MKKKMATNKILEGRTSSCLRKYRIFFAIVSVIMCIQIYLAYSFFILENQNEKSEVLSAKWVKIEDVFHHSKQLKLPPDKYGNINNNSQLKYNRTKMKFDKETLGFNPICELTGKESRSAVIRARSQECRELIVNVSCLNQQEKLYPNRLYSLCPHSTGFIGQPYSLGCFKDDKNHRILGDYYVVFKVNNSPRECAFLCLQSGYPYAGTEYSTECFCGSKEPSSFLRLPDPDCNMKCSGDSNQFCGGYLTINIYQTGIQKFKAQEARNATNLMKIEKESSVRIAYLLTVNGRASRQVKRLIKILYDPLHFYYIHVDARQDYMYREMLRVEKACRRKNIKVAKGTGLRRASIWGGASLLTTFLISAQQMLQSPHHWDFLVNLSESDFPIKTNTQLVEFLTWNRGLNFVKSHGREVQRFISKQGLDKTFIECEARMWRLGDRKLSKGIQIDGGSDWVALSRDFVEYVSNPMPDALVSGLLKIFQYTLLPAESFFHTVLRNSKFCDTYVDNNLHVTNWKRKLGCKCQYKAIVDWCGCSPNDFKLDDLNRIKNTRDKNLFFARKFEPVIDQRIINKVEDWLYPKKKDNNETNITGNDNDSDEDHNNDMYWQNLYHYGDLSPINDDVILTVSNSLARIIFSKYLSLHFINDIRLLETTAYFQKNKLAGILILVEANYLNNSKSNSASHVERIEAFVKFKRYMSIHQKWIKKINLLSVNTEYDKKEQTFRNFLSAIGPLSNPILAYEFDTTAIIIPKNLTVLWIQPDGHISDINFIQLDETSSIGSIKPTLNVPLQIGKWHVLILADNTVLIVQLAFFITPLEYWKNNKISEKKAKEFHNGSDKFFNHIPHEFSEKWLDIIKNAGIYQKPKENDHEIRTEQRIGHQLNIWIDEIVEHQYKIEQVCFVNSVTLFAQKESIRGLQECIQTNWSSLSPDPKSDIYHLDTK